MTMFFKSRAAARTFAKKSGRTAPTAKDTRGWPIRIA